MVFVRGLDVRKEKAEAKEGAQDRKYAKDTKRAQSSELSRTDWPKLLRTAKKVVLRLWSKQLSDRSRRGNRSREQRKETERKEREERSKTNEREQKQRNHDCSPFQKVISTVAVRLMIPILMHLSSSSCAGLVPIFHRLYPHSTYPACMVCR